MSDEIKDTEVVEETVAPEAVSESVTEIKTQTDEVPASAPAAAEGTGAAAADDTNKRNGFRPRKEFGSKDGQQRMPRFKKKMCRFCHDKTVPIDYKRADILENFITDRGKILPRRITGTCARHQRDVAREIKRARIIATLPFVEK